MENESSDLQQLDMLEASISMFVTVHDMVFFVCICVFCTHAVH